MRLLCSFFRLKELFQVKKWFNDVITVFFFENAKKLGRSDDAKRRKKQDGLASEIRAPSVGNLHFGLAKETKNTNKNSIKFSIRYFLYNNF